MTTLHNLGFPRIGARRELKQAVEAYWAGDLQQTELEHVGKSLRERHWALQADAGLDLVPVGDFAWYDQILEFSCLLGVVPPRFQQAVFGQGARGDQPDHIPFYHGFGAALLGCWGWYPTASSKTTTNR